MRRTGLRASVEDWAFGPEPNLPLSPGWPRGIERLVPASLLAVVAATAWVPWSSALFQLRPALPLAALAVAWAYNLRVNALNDRRPFAPPLLLASAVVQSTLVQLFAWSLALCSELPGALFLASGPILAATSQALRLRPTLRFPWPLAALAIGSGVAFLLAPPDRATVVLVVAPLTLAISLLLGPYAERLRRTGSLAAEQAGAIRARELEARAADLSGLSASLVELMQRAHDARSALSGALLDAEQLGWLAERSPERDAPELRASAASLRATLERLRQLVDTRRGLRSSTSPVDTDLPAVAVMPAVLFVVAAARLRTSSARLAARAGQGAKGARARVAGGEESLSRMLEILVENGWQGDGARRASQVEVLVSVQEHTGALAIAVRDDGPGFAPDSLARPLAPFVTTKPGALGLGLYTAERLARASGGSLERANAPGDGAVVTLFLQLAPPEEACTERAGAPAAQP